MRTGGSLFITTNLISQVVAQCQAYSDIEQYIHIHTRDGGRLLTEYS